MLMNPTAVTPGMSDKMAPLQFISHLVSGSYYWILSRRENVDILKPGVNDSIPVPANYANTLCKY